MDLHYQLVMSFFPELEESEGRLIIHQQCRNELILFRPDTCHDLLSTVHTGQQAAQVSGTSKKHHHNS